MSDKHLRELWKLRFQKILGLEKEALIFYSDLLKKHESILNGTNAKDLLESIAKDEAQHVQIAKELVRILEKKKVTV